MPYKRCEGDDMQMQNTESENPALINDVMYHHILSMALSPKLDTLLFSTDANQIMKLQVNLERPSEVDKYEHMISSFHSNCIVGLDVCIKKQIIATCSYDRTVRIWSYGGSNNTFTLDIWRIMKEDTLSLALHPSGFHLVLGLQDRVAMMNILNNDLDEYK